MIGLTSYRDYFAKNNLKLSSKFESLCQYAFDLEEALEEEISIIATKAFEEPDNLSQCDKILLFEHPLSFLENRGKAGFTTPNVRMHFLQLREIADWDKEVLSCNLELQIPETWVRRLSNRRTNPKTMEWDWPTDATLLKLLHKGLEGTQTSKFKEVRLRRTHKAIGDSHAFMLWRPDRTAEAIPAKTLFGVLKAGLQTYLPAYTTHATFCFGNIDLRHHLNRQPNPKEAAEELAKEYVKQGSQLDVEEVSFCELLPVISLNQRVSKSYYYKNEPHYGSVEDRSNLRDIFNLALRKECDKYPNTRALLCPTAIIDGDGLFDENAIERTTGGIHLSTNYYEISASTKQQNSDCIWQP